MLFLRKNGKFIISYGISSLILAKVFGWGNKGPGIKLTVGESGNDWKYSETIELVDRLGNKHVKCDIDEFVFDKENKIFSTPT